MPKGRRRLSTSSSSVTILGVPRQFSSFYAQRNNAYPLCLAQHCTLLADESTVARAYCKVQLPATLNAPLLSLPLHEFAVT
jgi:hypothetical protein